jgi:hypothetical protein
MKWLQSLLPLLLVVATALAPQLQAVISTHPTIAVVFAAAVAIANHLSPQPQK